VKDEGMQFGDLAWAAFLYFYRSSGDKKYGKVMRDIPFLASLRNNPSSISKKEFEEKIILNLIKIENYDLLLRQGFAEQILAMIIDLQPELSALRDISILNCDLSDKLIIAKINNSYRSLCSISGLWSTGASKILHVLNDRLFTILDPCITTYFGLIPSEREMVPFLKVVQANAIEIMKDYHAYAGSPEVFLAERLGYAQQGYHKSLVKFIDEFYILHIVDGLPIPPNWVPSCEIKEPFCPGR
jgi:hypothetical protein